MPFKLGDFFPKRTINEPFLDLNDLRWGDLEGGCKRQTYDASYSLKKLAQSKTLNETDVIYKELWNELHHQGDVGLASYYAVPHLVRIAKETGLIDLNVLGLVSCIEIQRHKQNPGVPKALLPAYENAIKDLLVLVNMVMHEEWDFSFTSLALAAIALAKGQYKLGNVIFNFDSEEEVDDLLEKY